MDLHRSATGSRSTTCSSATPGPSTPATGTGSTPSSPRTPQIDYTESGGIAARFPEVKPWLAEMLPAFFPKRMHTLGQVEIAVRRATRPTCRRTSTTRCRWTTGRAGRRSSSSAGIYHHTMIRTPGRLAQPEAPRRGRLEAWALRMACPSELAKRTEQLAHPVDREGHQDDGPGAGAACSRPTERPDRQQVADRGGLPQAGADAAARARRPEVRRDATRPRCSTSRTGPTSWSSASQGGLPKNPQWYHNLMAHPDTRVRLKRETRDGRAPGWRTPTSGRPCGRGWSSCTPTSTTYQA